MLLGKLLKSISKDYQKIHVDGISYDSRKVKKGDIFFAIKGNRTSGTKFINDVISKGASAIIINKKTKYKNYQIPLILVNDPGIMRLGVKPGDMIKITRKSATAGESFYYRYVVEV